MTVIAAASLEEFLEGVAKRVAEVRDLVVRARRALGDAILKLSCRSADINMVAVDSAFPRTPLETMGFSVAPIAAALARCRGGEVVKVVKHEILFSVDEAVKPELVAVRARLMERALAIRYLGEADLVVFDGEIVPAREARLDERLARLSRTVVLEARRRGIIVAGVIKRTRSRHLAARVGAAITDKALAALMLKPCEAVVIEHPRAELRELGCLLALYKPARGLAFSVKVEVCGDPEVLGVLAAEPGWSGLPWLIDLVDSLAKQEVERMIALVDAKLKSISSRVGLLELGAPLNPQEARSRQLQRSLS